MMINYSCKGPRTKKAPEVAFLKDLLTEEEEYTDVAPYLFALPRRNALQYP